MVFTNSTGTELEFSNIGSSWSIKVPKLAPFSARRHESEIPYEVEPSDPYARSVVDAEATFFTRKKQESLRAARHKYPQKQTRPEVDSLSGEQEETVRRRIQGFGFGFEKIFATTSVKLPVSAYTIYVELQSAQDGVTFSRCFNGIHSIYDLKKWLFEKLLVPPNAYDLSYAEPGKATLTDQLRLLTMQESLDARTLATTRAVRGMFRGTPGVHSINDIGVTKLYARLKCQKTGELLSNLQIHPEIQVLRGTSRERRPLFGLGGQKAPTPDRSICVGQQQHKVKPDNYRSTSLSEGQDSTIEDSTDFADCVKVHRNGRSYYYNTRGYELYEAARAHGGASQFASIYLSCGKKMAGAHNVLLGRACTEDLY